MATNSQAIIDGLMEDIIGDEPVSVHKDDLSNTITNILKDYNLPTDLGFVEKMATMKFHKNGESFDMMDMPNELHDAAFLPVNTIADIALRQDLDLTISQIPEWYRAVQIARDAICESDLVDGRLSRTISFNKSNLDEIQTDSIISKIEDFEERLELHTIIKNHIVFDTLLYGEGYIYAIPYAKVFEDLYRYRLNVKDNGRKTQKSAYDTSSVLNGYGYGESAKPEILLNDTIINDASDTNRKKKKQSSIFTEAEIMEINPGYHSPNRNDLDLKTQTNQNIKDRQFDEMISNIAKNISYIGEDIALPVIEESAHDLKCVYETKYKDVQGYVGEVKTIFEQVMESDTSINPGISQQFSNIKGIYLRVLPGTKLIPIRVDRVVIGYYYISDLTRPEESGERRNSGLSGYTLSSPSVGYDSFSPDKMFCEKLATKIINNFDLKFMRDNTALHQQIVAILQSHKFDESRMRFIFIPAEHVIQCTINKDGIGKGHSMLEPGLTAARMYMFLKLYSLLYQINNSQIRVYNLRMSGIDKNYKEFVQETMRKFAARRITSNDIFNYRSSMTKVSGGSELIMPMGTSDLAPITVETIPAAEAPINTEFLDSMKHEAINAQPVPSAMLMGAMSEIEFAKEVEMSNTFLNSFVASCKIDNNRDITRLYRLIAKWETDIDDETIRSLKFSFKMAAAKQLSVTNEMIQNFNAVAELATQLFLTSEEQKNSGEGENGSEYVREMKKILMEKFLPINVEDLEEAANEARNKVNVNKLEHSDSEENLLNDADDAGEEMM